MPVDDFGRQAEHARHVVIMPGIPGQNSSAIRTFPPLRRRFVESIVEKKRSTVSIARGNKIAQSGRRQNRSIGPRIGGNVINECEIERCSIPPRKILAVIQRSDQVLNCREPSEVTRVSRRNQDLAFLDQSQKTILLLLAASS